MDKPGETDRTEELDAWSARFVREPLGQVPIDLICLVDSPATDVDESASVIDTLRRKGRLGRVIPVIPDRFDRSLGAAYAAALNDATAPIVLFSDMRADWNRDILERLIKAIDSSDLALGARPCQGRGERIRRSLACLGRGVFWGAGVLDPATPYKIARTEVVKRIPLQSSGRFVDVELIAKANFLDALIHEEVLPAAMPWASPTFGPSARGDQRNLFRNPRFRHEERAPRETCDEIVAAVDRGSNENAGDVSQEVAPSRSPNEDVRTPDSGG